MKSGGGGGGGGNILDYNLGGSAWGYAPQKFFLLFSCSETASGAI